MVKPHKCPTCGKSFMTPQALAQHATASHGAKKQRPKKNRASAGSKAGVAPVGGATFFQPVSVRQVADDTSTHRGVDRVAHVADISVFNSGSVVLRLPVNAGVFSRLSALAETYQQVRFQSLQFKVTPYAAANVGGGYVAGFVRDPDDEPPTGESQRLNWLSSQAGCVTTRWTQQSVISAGQADRWYYTSPGVESREYSPGTLYIVVDSKATAAAGLTVWAHWTVQFRKATLESHPLKGLVAAQNLYTQNGHIGLWGKSGSTWVDNNDKLFPGWKLGASLRLAAPITIPVTTASNDTTSRVVWWVKFTSQNDCKFCYESPTEPSDEKAAAEVLVVPAGTFLEFASDNADLMGEVPGPPSLPSANRGAFRSSETSAESSSQLLSTLSTLASSLSNVCQTFQTLQLDLARRQSRESWTVPPSLGGYTTQQAPPPGPHHEVMRDLDQLRLEFSGDCVPHG